MTDFKALVEKKLKEKYSDDPQLADALSLISRVFEWNEEGRDMVEDGVKSEIKQIVGSAKEDLEALQSEIEGT